MQLKDGKLVRTDIWREGTYLDLWSIPHFLSGMVVALALLLIGFTPYVAAGIAFLLLVAWEFFEYFAGIEEGRMNSMLDVVVGMASFVPTYWWGADANTMTLIIAFIVVAGADLILSTFGWIASHKAHVLEKKLKSEFLIQRERMRRRRRMIRARIEDGQTKWRERRKLWKERRKARQRRSPTPDVS